MLPAAAILAVGISALPASAAVSGAAKATAHAASPVLASVRPSGPGSKAAPGAFNGGYFLENGNTKLCIDDSSQYGLRGYPCNAGSYNSGYQSWIVHVDSSTGNFQLQNKNTGLCIDDSSQYGLRGYPCNGPSYNSGYQQWIHNGSSPYQLQNRKTGLCIDDSSQYGLRGYPCNGPSYNSGYQAWYSGYWG
jgi:hypothetical protein